MSNIIINNERNDPFLDERQWNYCCKILIKPNRAGLDKHFDKKCTNERSVWTPKGQYGGRGGGQFPPTPTLAWH